jgi:hypothetical protein
MMKKTVILLSVLMAFLVSCGPSKHVMHIDMRYPSKSGVDLAGKIPSVVYLDTEDTTTSTFNAGMASSFASSIEKDLGMQEGSVVVYRMPKDKSTDYSSKDSMLALIADTDADVVFLFDEVKLGQQEASTTAVMVPFTMTLYCFDGMDKSEEVRVFTGSSRAYIDGSDAGITVAQSFKIRWKTEPYSLAYYDNEKWYKALDKAEAYDWKGAIDQWFTRLDTNDLMRRACAEYNIAVACYMLGDYALAQQWLDRSDADNKLPNMSDALRKRIDSRK